MLSENPRVCSKDIKLFLLAAITIDTDRKISYREKKSINVFEEEELDAAATVRKFRTVQQEGQHSVQRDIDHYNLDVIISVGYRVKSPQGTQF